MYVILKDVSDVNTLEHILIKMSSIFIFSVRNNRRKLYLEYLFLLFLREQAKKRLKYFGLRRKIIQS